MKNIIFFVLIFCPLLSQATIKANRRTVLGSGPVSFLMGLFQPQAPAADPTKIVIDAAQIFHPDIQDADGSIVKARTRAFHRLWVDSRSSDVDQLSNAKKYQHFGPLQADLLEDWLVTHPDAEIQTLLDKYDLIKYAFANPNFISDDPLVFEIRQSPRTVFKLRERLERDLAKYFYERITEAPWKNLSWAQVFGPKIAAMELRLAYKYNVGMGKVDHAVEFGINGNYKIDSQIRSLVLGQFQPEDLELYSSQFINEYYAGLAKISPRFFRHRHESPGFQKNNRFKNDWIKTVRNTIASALQAEFDERGVRSFAFNKLANGFYLLKQHPGVPPEYTAAYLEFLKELENLREILFQLPISDFKTVSLEQVEYLIKIASEELNTLPQRLDIQRKISEARASRISSSDLENHPPPTSLEWRTFGFSNASEAFTSSMKWLETVRETGMKLGLSAKVLESLALALHEPEPCNVLLMEAPVEDIAEDKNERQGAAVIAGNVSPTIN